MKETKFIEQNKEKWAEYEQIILKGNSDPERLNEMFVQVTDDLSYARTFYPNRSVRLFLNGMAQRIFNNVYKARRLPLEHLRTFWTHELPQVMWETRFVLLLSFAVFLLSLAIGVVSSMANPDFASVILGPGYVQETLNNIANKDPMAIYKDSNPFGSTNLIAINNLRVAMLTAISGVFASVGTLFILMQNGVMVGTFQYFFIERGLFWDSFLTIWIHGTLEISMIVIAGAAGIVAGSGLLFPGTYTRMQAFRMSIKRGLKILFGIAPLIILAAIFEGYLTRYTETPDFIRGMFILTSLIFVLWYFVWLPWHKARTGQFVSEHRDADLPPDRMQGIHFGAIKSTGEILSDAFTVLKRHPKITFGGMIGVLALFTGAFYLYSGHDFAEEGGMERHRVFALATLIEEFFEGDLFYVEIGLFAILSALCFRAVEMEMDLDRFPLFSLSQFAVRVLWLLVPMPLFMLIYATDWNILSWLLCILIFPLLSLWSAVIYFEGSNPVSALIRSFGIMRLGQSLSVGLLTTSFGLLFFLFTDSFLLRNLVGFSFWDMLVEFFSWFVPPTAENLGLYNFLINSFVGGLVVYFFLMLSMFCGAFQYFSNVESADANYLQEGIKKLGLVRRIRGIARE